MMSEICSKDDMRDMVPEYGFMPMLARCMSADMHFGEAFAPEVYSRIPEESYERILSHLRRKLPDAPERPLRRVIG